MWNLNQNLYIPLKVPSLCLGFMAGTTSKHSKLVCQGKTSCFCQNLQPYCILMVIYHAGFSKPGSIHASYKATCTADVVGLELSVNRALLLHVHNNRILRHCQKDDCSILQSLPVAVTVSLRGFCFIPDSLRFKLLRFFCFR